LRQLMFNPVEMRDALHTELPARKRQLLTEVYTEVAQGALRGAPMVPTPMTIASRDPSVKELPTQASSASPHSVTPSINSRQAKSGQARPSRLKSPKAASSVPSQARPSSQVESSQVRPSQAGLLSTAASTAPTMPWPMIPPHMPPQRQRSHREPSLPSSRARAQGFMGGRRSLRTASTSRAASKPLLSR